MRLRPILLMLAAMAPLGARAQTTATVQPNEPTLVIATGNSTAFNQDTCKRGDNATTVLYNFPSSFSAGAKVEVYAISNDNATSCNATVPSNAIILLALTPLSTSNTSQTVSIAANKLFPSADCPPNVEKVFHICAVSTVLAANGTTGVTSDGPGYTAVVDVTYDSLQPSSTTIESVTAGDSAINLTWNGQSGVDHWIVYYKTNGPKPVDNASLCSTATSSSSLITVCDDAGLDCVDKETKCDNGDVGCRFEDGGAIPDTGQGYDASPPFDGTGWQHITIADGTISKGQVSDLKNDQKYLFTVVAVDAAGNVAPEGNSVEGTPLVVQDFYRRYRCQGGDEKGGFGCSTTAGALLVPLAGLGLVAVLRRRRSP